MLTETAQRSLLLRGPRPELTVAVLSVAESGVSPVSECDVRGRCLREGRGIASVGRVDAVLSRLEPAMARKGAITRPRGAFMRWAEGAARAGEERGRTQPTSIKLLTRRATRLPPRGAVFLYIYKACRLPYGRRTPTRYGKGRAQKFEQCTQLDFEEPIWTAAAAAGASYTGAG